MERSQATPSQCLHFSSPQAPQGGYLHSKTARRAPLACSRADNLAPRPTLAVSTTTPISPPSLLSQAVLAPTQPPKAAVPQVGPIEEPPIVLPSSGLPPISGHLVQAIKVGRYIELADLLPEVLRKVQFDRNKYSEGKEDEK